MQSKGPCDAQMSWDASKARDLPDTAAGCFRKWSLFGGDAPAFRSSRKNSYCIAGESILRHVGTARRGLGEKCVLPRLDIGCRDHRLNCWNTDCPAGRTVISALTGLFCYVLPWRFLWEGCAGCAPFSLPFCLPSTVGGRGLSASIGTLSGEGSSRSQFFRPAVPSRGYFSHSLPRRLPTS